MANTTNNCSTGSIFVELLQVLFIGLKLTGYIDWSWWWVMSPTWISFILLLIIIAFVGIFVWATK